MHPAERWRKVQSLYHAAHERRPEERLAFLTAACSGDDALRQEVESLLDDESKAQNWLSTPAVQLAAQMVTGDGMPSLLGQQIGNYQIVSLLGVGGMGEVYRALDTRLGERRALQGKAPAVVPPTGSSLAR